MFKMNAIASFQDVPRCPKPFINPRSSLQGCIGVCSLFSYCSGYGSSKLLRWIKRTRLLHDGCAYFIEQSKGTVFFGVLDCSSDQKSKLTSLQNLLQTIGKAKRFSQLSCPGPPAYLTARFKLRLKTNAVRPQAASVMLCSFPIGSQSQALPPLISEP